jgi:hypothetical protein
MTVNADEAVPPAAEAETGVVVEVEGRSVRTCGVASEPAGVAGTVAEDVVVADATGVSRREMCCCDVVGHLLLAASSHFCSCGNGVRRSPQRQTLVRRR